MTQTTDEKDLKKHIKAQNDKIMRRAEELAHEHVENFAYTVYRQGIIGAVVSLEYRAQHQSLNTLYVQAILSSVGASISGSVFHNHLDDVGAFMVMLEQACEIANAYLADLERTGGTQEKGE